MFSTDPVVLDSAWLLPAEELKTYLRKTDAAVKTEKSGEIEYIRSTDLVSAGLAKEVKVTENGLVITPLNTGANLLLPDSGEISWYSEANCHQVDMLASTDNNGVYFTMKNISASGGGMLRFFTREAKMYGAGTYRLTFKARSDETGKISAGYTSEVSTGNKSFSVNGEWTEYTYDIPVKEGEQLGSIIFWLRPNTTPFVTSFEVRDVSLVKVP